MKKWPLPFVVAHRGASNIAPENTISALKLAKKYGAQYVECDVQLTRDLQPIIIHDKTLDRTSNGSGLIFDTDFSDIQKLDAGSWFSKKYAGEKIPTLQEWVQCAATLNMGVNIEIKTEIKNHAAILAAMVVATLKSVWSETLPNPLISSFNFFAIESVAQLSQDYLLGWNSEKKIHIKNIPDFIQSVHFSEIILTEQDIYALHAANRKVMGFTVDNMDRANALHKMKLDGIFSNNEKLF